MPALSSYLIKVILISAVMYGYYLVMLRNRKFHRYNRFYLLSSVLIPLVLPFIPFDSLFATGSKDIPLIIQKDFVQDAIVINMSSRFWNTENILAVIYLSVAIVLLILFATSLIRIISIRRNGKLIEEVDCKIIETEAKGTPFSFFRFIFWNPKIDLDSEDGHKILHHELIHVRQLHSLDKLMVNLVQIIFWFNPVFWLIKSEIVMVHEFLADRESLGDSDPAGFSKMALQAAYPGFTWPATNGFAYSPLKRRLTMILKNNKRKVSYFGRLMALPLAALMFMFFSTKAHEWRENQAAAKNFSEQELHSISEAGIAPVVLDSLPSDALYILNGKKIDLATMKNISPDDIQSVSVLKGKSALKKYSDPRAKNGVVEIVTKKYSQKTKSENIKLNSLPLDALYILNGKEVGLGIVKNISPDDIQSVSVLKGESAFRKYSNPNAKNGVVEIVTKEFAKNHDSSPLQNGNTIRDTVPQEDRIFTKVELEAQFPGGTAAWRAYITKAIQKDLARFTEKDFGTCIVKFVVDLDGSVSHVEATTMQETELARVSEDAIRNGPKWIPAQQNGKAVKAFRLQPVTLTRPEKDINDTTIHRVNPQVDKVFVRVEKAPEFPGGREAWKRYTERILQKYGDELPESEKGQSCKLRFIVDQEGYISDVQALTMKGTKLAEIAVNALRKGPRWIPAEQNGHIVTAFTEQTFGAVVK